MQELLQYHIHIRSTDQFGVREKMTEMRPIAVGAIAFGYAFP